MASWQAHLASWAVRARFKGLPFRPHPMRTVADVRARMAGGPRTPARGVRITPGVVGGVAGEWLAPAAAEKHSAGPSAPPRPAPRSLGP